VTIAEKVEIFSCVGLRPKQSNLNIDTVGGLDCYFQIAMVPEKIWGAFETCFGHLESKGIRITAYTFSSLAGCSDLMKFDLLDKLNTNIIQPKDLKNLADFSKRVDKVSFLLDD
jgi:hypothetical protein